MLFVTRPSARFGYILKGFVVEYSAKPYFFARLRRDSNPKHHRWRNFQKPSQTLAKIPPVGKEPKRGKGGGGISARNSTDGMDYGMSSMRCKLQKDVNWHFRWLSWWCVFRSVCDHDDSLLQYWAKNKMRFEAVEFARGRATDCTWAYRSRFLINKWFQLIVFDQTLFDKNVAISDFSPTWNQNSFTNLSVGAQTLWSCSTHQFYNFWKFHQKILIFSEVIDDFPFYFTELQLISNETTTTLYNNSKTFAVKMVQQFTSITD